MGLKEQLKYSIDQIDLAIEQGRAEGYRICSCPDPGDKLAQFWGLDGGGTQRFGTHRNLLVMVAFPSEKLAKRVVEWTGGYVVPVKDILLTQRKRMEKKYGTL